MGAASQRRTHVARQASEVRPAAHPGPEREVGRRAADEGQLRDFHAPRRKLDGFAPARPAVGALAGQLHRGIRGRPLVVGSAERRQHPLHMRRIETAPGVRGRDRLARRVVGAGGGPESDHALVRLGPRRGERRESRGAPDHDHEQSRGERIERTQVTHPVGAERPTHHIDDVVRGGPLRASGLRHERDARDQPAPSFKFRRT